MLPRRQQVRETTGPPHRIAHHDKARHLARVQQSERRAERVREVAEEAWRALAIKQSDHQRAEDALDRLAEAVAASLTNEPMMSTLKFNPTERTR